jgi:hypothetical protein
MVPGSRGWIVSKTYDLTEKVFRYVKATILHKWNVKPTRKSESAPFYLELPWGSVVEGKTADNPDSLLGEGLDWLVFDECAACKGVIWQQYLRPTLTDREGRALFITTPRGYNWLYDLWERGQSQEFPEWSSWRSPSWDNPYLSKNDIEEAKRTLSPMIFEQEYGASFQSNIGSVYPDFGVLSHGISKPEIDPRWRHFRSIDFGYENPFVCLWIAVDPTDRVIIYDEYYRSHVTVEQAADDIFTKELEHAQWWDIKIPRKRVDNEKDALDYEWTTCDPSAASARATLLEKGMETIAPRSDVVGGIELVRQQLKFRDDSKPGLVVDIDRCPNTVKEFNLYSYPEPTSRNSNELPTKENDHACLVGDTMIFTSDGYKKIKEIKEGDKVLTRKGFRYVLDVGCTGISNVTLYEFSDGKCLVGTDDHKLIIKSQNIPLHALSYFDIIYTIDNHFNNLKNGDILCQQKSNLLNLMELYLEDTQKLKIAQVEHILLRLYTQSLKGQEDCMKKYGLQNMEIFQKNMQYTIKTLIHQITILQILNVYQKYNIRDYMPTLQEECISHYQKTHLKRRRCGINHQKAENFTNILAPWDITMPYIKNIIALLAERNSSPETLDIKKKDIAQIVVEPQKDEKTNWTTNQEFAHFAEKNIALINIQKAKPVRVIARHKCEKRQKVYNLTIDGDHEYFANGILVANCDALRYFVTQWRKRYIRQTTGVY